jgi:hypothetical protein
MEPDRELMLRLQRESAERSSSLRELLRERGREDLIREYDKAMWEIETGVAQAHSTWAALTPTQKRVMIALYEGRVLTRESGSRVCYKAFANCYGSGATSRLCRLDTAMALLRRDLLAKDGLANDPFIRFVLTKKGHFVVKRAAALGEKGNDNDR